MRKLFTKRTMTSTALWIALVVCIFPLVACQSLPNVEVKVKDAKWYGLKGNQGAHFFHTLSDSTGDITKEQWDAISFGKLCTDSANFANWSATIQKLCDACNCCETEPVQDMMRFMSRVQRFRTEAGLL